MPHTIIIHLQADGERCPLLASTRRTEDGQRALELTGGDQAVVFWPVEADGLRELAGRLNALADDFE